MYFCLKFNQPLETGPFYLDKIMDRYAELQLSDVLNNIRTCTFNPVTFQEKLFVTLKKSKGKVMLEALLEAEAHLRNKPSTSPKQRNIRNTHRKIAQLLANRADNRDFYDSKKRTVLHYCAWYKWNDIGRFLVRHLADVNAQDIDGQTPLYYAALHCNERIVKLSPARSVAVVKTNVNGSSALRHVAAYSQSVEFARILLEADADPNVCNKNGATALQVALNGPYTDMTNQMIELLLNSGAKLSVCTFKDVYAVAKRCAKWGSLNILQHLVERDLLQDVDKLPLFSIACRKKQIKIVKYLVQAMNTDSGCDDTVLNYVTKHIKDPELVKNFILQGGYLDHSDYERMVSNEYMKKGILQSIELCTSSTINKFNDKDLPDFKELPKNVDILIPIEDLKITDQNSINIIKENIKHEIETVGHCNPTKPRTLSMSAIKSYIDYFDNQKKKTQCEEPSKVAEPRVIRRSLRCAKIIKQNARKSIKRRKSARKSIRNTKRLRKF